MSTTNYLNYDPVDAANHYLWDQEKAASRLPVCDICGEHIYGQYEYHLDDMRLCEDCADDWWEKLKHEAQTEVELED